MIKEMNRFLGHPTDTLDDLISNYMKRVPFENIDVQNKVPISLELGDLFDKIITRDAAGLRRATLRHSMTTWRTISITRIPYSSGN